MISQKTLQEISELGSSIYVDRFKAQLEPQYNNQYIAIHVDSGDHAIAKTTSTATRELLKTHTPDGRIYVQRIGPEPEYALAARLLSGEMQAENAK